MKDQLKQVTINESTAQRWTRNQHQTKMNNSKSQDARIDALAESITHAFLGTDGQAMQVLADGSLGYNKWIGAPIQRSTIQKVIAAILAGEDGWGETKTPKKTTNSRVLECLEVMHPELCRDIEDARKVVLWGEQVWGCEEG